MLLSGPIGTQKCQGLNTVQRRMKSTTLLEEMTKITDYANPSETVMLQAFNWESHKAGRGDWYGIVASKLQMFKETWLDLAFRLPTPDLTLSRVFLQIRLKTAEVTARYTNIIRSHPTHIQYRGTRYGMVGPWLPGHVGPRRVFARTWGSQISGCRLAQPQSHLKAICLHNFSTWMAPNMETRTKV